MFGIPKESQATPDLVSEESHAIFSTFKKLKAKMDFVDGHFDAEMMCILCRGGQCSFLYQFVERFLSPYCEICFHIDKRLVQREAKGA